MDGHADRNRQMVVDIGGGLEVEFISVEDLIADRVGQFEAEPKGDQELLEQAKRLYRTFGSELDEAYLDKRLRTEAPGRSLTWLKETSNAANDP